MPTVLTEPSVVDFLANSLLLFDLPIAPFNSPSSNRHANGSSTSQTYTFTVNPLSGQPLAGNVNWYAEVLGPTGMSTDDIITTVDPTDSTHVTVSVDDTVVGDVVVYASYVSTNGALVVGHPTLVVSHPPTGATVTGIDLGQTQVSVSVGDTIPFNIFTEYSDGSRVLQFIPRTRA